MSAAPDTRAAAVDAIMAAVDDILARNHDDAPTRAALDLIVHELGVLTGERGLAAPAPTLARESLAARLEALVLDDAAGPETACDALFVRVGYCARPADDFAHAAATRARETHTHLRTFIDSKDGETAGLFLRLALRETALAHDLLRAAVHALDAAEETAP